MHGMSSLLTASNIAATVSSTVLVGSGQRQRSGSPVSLSGGVGVEEKSCLRAVAATAPSSKDTLARGSGFHVGEADSGEHDELDPSHHRRQSVWSERSWSAKLGDVPAEQFLDRD